jgi:hypothetical protein
MSKLKSIGLLICAGIVSLLLSVAFINYGAMELGAIIYMFVPVASAFLLLVLFLLLDIFLSRFRVKITVIFILLNLLVGIFMRMDFYFNILHL